MRYPVAILAATLLLFCACASEEWRKESGEVATRQVISDCTHQAMARADAEGLATGTYVGAQSNMGARTGRTEFPRDQSPPANTGIREQALFNQCMSGKGYELLPATPRSRP